MSERDERRARALAAVTVPAMVAVPGGLVKSPTPPGYADCICRDADEVHRVEVGDSDIPYAICPHSGAIEVAPRETWSERAREAYATMDAVLRDLYAPQRGTRHADVVRAIDLRSCDLLRPEDADWGEGDSLDNVPRQECA